MADDFPPGSSSCVRCRTVLPPGYVICDCTKPVAGAKPAPSLASPVESPFVLVMAIGILVAFFAYYDPVRLKEQRGGSVSPASKLDPELERWRQYGDELRRRYLEAYGGGDGRPVTIDQLRGIIQEKLKDIDRDPSYSPEQRAEIRRIVNRALREKGF